MADLKNENPNAVKYFKERGRRYFQLREDLKRFQLSEIELGDLSIDEIRKIGAMVQAKFAKGGKAEVEKFQRTYEQQAIIFQEALEDVEHTPLDDMAKIQLNKDKAETMLNLINMFKNIVVRLDESKKQAQEAVAKISEARKNLVSASKKPSGDGIVPSVDQLKKAVDSFTTANGAYESAAYAYNQATLQNVPELGLKAMSLAELEELYITLKTAIRDAKKELADPAKAPKVQRNIDALEDAVKLLESKVDKKTLKDLQAKAEAKFKEDEKDFEEEDKRRIRTTFKAQLSAAYNAMLKAFKEKYTSKDWNPRRLIKAVSDKNELLTTGYEEIAVADKLELDRQFAAKYKEALKKYYGEALYAAIGEVENIISQIAALNRLSPEDKSLATKVAAVMGQIDRFKESKFVKDGGVVVTQGENSIEFKFADERVADRKIDRILSEVLYDKLHPKKEDKPEDKKKDEKPEDKKDETPEDKKDKKPEDKKSDKKPDETPSEAEAKDIEFYLNLLRETNAKVAEVNRINNSLVITTNFRDLDMDNILKDVSDENTAVYASAIITKLRMELSDKRYEFLKKYGKYILSTPEVRETKIDEIKFNAEIDEFLAKHDELIVDAEREIARLYREKPKDYEKNIKNLQDFIKAQNSLIRRFLIAESITKDIDVAAILEARNARKAELHKMKDAAEKAMGGKPEDKPEDKKDEKTEGKKDETPEDKKDEKPEGKKDETPKDKKDETPEDKKDETPEDKKDEKPEGKKDETPEDKKDETPEDKKDETPEGKKDEKPEGKKDETPEDKFEPVPKGTTIPNVLIKNTELLFNPRNNQKVAKKISANDRLFTNSPKVTTTLIKNGVRIALSKQVRERLAELGAKLSLVNKENRRIRTSQFVDGEAETQDLVFKSDHDVNLENYTVEVRIPNGDRTAVLLGDEQPRRSR